MGLKYELDSIEDLDESVRGFYTESDGKYRLAIEGMPEPEDVSGLKSKVDELLKEKKAAAQKAREAEEAAEQARLEAAKKNGDTEALEASWRQKLESREAELQAELERYQGTVTQLTSGQTATKLAAELAVQGSADVLMPHIQGRLKTEYRDGQPVTVVLDKQGKPSAMSVDELKSEFQSNPAFAPLIVGSKASGAGRSGDQGSGGAVQKTVSRSEFDRMSQSERAAFSKDGGKVVDEQ